MIHKVLPLVIVACLVGSTWAQAVVNLPVQSETEQLRSRISMCVGQLVCGTTQSPSTLTISCVNADRVCDGTSDCVNGVDEHDCPRMCEGKVICPDKKTCAIPCDGISTCANGEDEMNCLPNCPKPQVLCSNLATCATVCDGTEQCPGKEDESNCSPTCQPNQMLCADGKTCARPCDRVDECPAAGDERNCPFQCTCGRGEYICRISNKCVKREDMCEFAADTPATSCLVATRRGDDEDSDSNGTQCN